MRKKQSEPIATWRTSMESRSPRDSIQTPTDSSYITKACGRRIRNVRRGNRSCTARHLTSSVKRTRPHDGIQQLDVLVSHVGCESAQRRSGARESRSLGRAEPRRRSDGVGLLGVDEALDGPRSRRTVMSGVGVRYIVDDVQAAMRFYTTHLGFEVERDASPAFA